MRVTGTFLGKSTWYFHTKLIELFHRTLRPLADDLRLRGLTAKPPETGRIGAA
jgi:hypothetical protein